MHNWKILEVIDPRFTAEHPDMHPVILQLLANRGILSAQDIKKFLNPRYEDLYDPFAFRDMQKAVERVKAAADAGETVFVYGDYDADGVTSAVLLAEALQKCGIKKTEVYIPHREKEGYGLNTDALDFIASRGAKLVITVDCGTSSVSEIAYAKKLGLDVVICDHHEEPAALPQNVTAFLNPHLKGEAYPFKNLSACGVVFKFVQALWKSFELPLGHEKWFLDLVAISTIADMMDLKDENRVFVSFGLKVLNKTKRIGLQSLISAMQARSEVLGVYEVGFLIGPRLNAAGRLDHANTAYELLETNDSAQALSLAQGLNETNIERQSETKRILAEANEQVKLQVANKKVLVAVGENWPVGVVGLASGRITEQFWRPSLVITNTKKGLTGSGRSIPGFNITEALSEASEYLERFGGHEGACGFTLKSKDVLEAFTTKLNEVANTVLKEKDLVKALGIDMELSLDQIDWDLVKLLSTLEPHGVANPAPKFASFGVRVSDVFLMGKENQHMRIKIDQNNTTHQAVAFGLGEKYKSVLNQGDLIDIVYTIDINEWKGKKDIQLKIVDIKKP